MKRSTFYPTKQIVLNFFVTCKSWVRNVKFMTQLNIGVFSCHINKTLQLTAVQVCHRGAAVIQNSTYYCNKYSSLWYFVLNFGTFSVLSRWSIWFQQWLWGSCLNLWFLYSGRCLVWISSWTHINLFFFCGFLQSIKANVKIVPWNRSWSLPSQSSEVYWTWLSYHIDVRFEIFMTVKIHSEDGGSKIIWNIGILPQHYMASQPSRPCLESSHIIGH